MTVENDNIPPCNIWVDKDGVWYYNGAEMFRKEIVNLFYENLRRDDNGRYIIDMANDRCYIEVEDAPFVVKTVYRRSNNGESDRIELLLNNLELDLLDPNSLRIGDGNVLYCSVKDGAFEARFSRASYYQIAEFAEYDHEMDSYYIFLNNQKYYLRESCSQNRDN